MPRKYPAKMTEETRRYVVTRLACYDTPKEICDGLKEEYNIEITPQTCQSYDYTKYQGRNLGKKWREFFDEVREKFLKEIEIHVPEANKAVRVRHLARAAQTLRSKGNYMGMADMLERIAKELGNVHTNRRELTGKDGGAIETKDMSYEQVESRLLTMVEQILGSGDQAKDK